MNHTSIKNGDQNFSLECFGTSKGIPWLLVSVSVLFFAIGCSSTQSKAPPTNPLVNRANEKDPTPSKTSTSERNSRDKDKDKDKDGDDTSEETTRRRTPPDNKKPPTQDARPRPPALDPALAKMTCDAPPIRGDAKKLIAYLNNPNPPGGQRLTNEEYQNALAATKGIDPDDPSSLKILQDQLDAACKI